MYQDVDARNNVLPVGEIVNILWTDAVTYRAEITGHWYEALCQVCCLKNDRVWFTPTLKVGFPLVACSATEEVVTIVVQQLSPEKN